MKLDEVRRLLRHLSENQLDDVHIVIPVPEGRKIGELIPGIKAEGFAALVRSTPFSDREIVVTDLVGNGNS